MSWPEVERLRDAGWEIGSHTRSHPKLSDLAGQLATELADRGGAASSSSAPCASIAYPYGDLDDAVMEASRAAGYSAAGALPDGGRRGTPSLAEDRGLQGG